MNISEEFLANLFSFSKTVEFTLSWTILNIKLQQKLTVDLFFTDLKKTNNEQIRICWRQIRTSVCWRFFIKPWYERDMMGYFDYLDYQDMKKNPTNYFEKNE